MNACVIGYHITTWSRMWFPAEFSHNVFFSFEELNILLIKLTKYINKKTDSKLISKIWYWSKNWNWLTEFKLQRGENNTSSSKPINIHIPEGCIQRSQVWTVKIKTSPKIHNCFGDYWDYGVIFFSHSSYCRNISKRKWLMLPRLQLVWQSIRSLQQS